MNSVQVDVQNDAVENLDYYDHAEGIPRAGSKRAEYPPATREALHRLTPESDRLDGRLDKKSEESDEQIESLDDYISNYGREYAQRMKASANAKSARRDQ